MKIENHKHKDTVFRMLYRDRKRLLELYNAVNGSKYDNPDDLEITTIKGKTFLNMKNDVSFVLDFELSLYEHQSTPCPNVPLRDLLYVAEIYRKLIPIEKTYGTRIIQIPTPKFIVFYNGTQEMEDIKEYKLSDMFMKQENAPSLELIVKVFNINEGHNKALLEACNTLREYSIFVAKVRKYIEEEKVFYNTSKGTAVDILDTKNVDHKKIVEKAVTRAIDDCIVSGILKDFFVQYRKEVVNMSVLEYSAEKHLQYIREEGYDDGFADGEAKGISKGISQGLDTGISGSVEILRSMNLDDDTIIEKICQQYGLDKEAAKKYL